MTRFNAWWSFYIKANSRRRLKAGPWQEIQEALGTRLGRFVFTQQPTPPGTYHVEADLLVEAPSPASAAVAVHHLARRLGGNWQHAWRLNEAPDANQPEIAAFYRRHLHELTIPKLTSAGVQLAPVLPGGPDRSRVPMLRVDAPSALRRNFVIDFAISIQVSQQRKLLERAWPAFCRRFTGPVAIVEFEARAGETGPFRFTARQRLDEITDVDAVAACLRQTAGMTLAFSHDADGRLLRLAGVHSQEPLDLDRTEAFEISVV